MGCIIGFGGYMPKSYYIIIASATKLIKEDLLVTSTISFNIILTQHKIMTLLLRYISEAFFGILIYAILIYREYIKNKKKRSLSDEDKETKTSNPLTEMQ